jgi:RNA polymerase sigma-70 factor (ECF subfamily)
MRSDEYEKLETRIHQLCERGMFGKAIEVALNGYGPEIRHWLRYLLRNDDDLANEAYSIFCEGLISSLPNFRWECSFKTWANLVTRRIGLGLRKSPARVRELHASDHILDQHVRDERSETEPWRRTNVKLHVRELRASLEPEDEKLIELHVGRGLSWNEVARELAGGKDLRSPAELARRAATLRQRYKRAKARLRVLVKQAHVLTDLSLMPSGSSR